MSAIIVHLTSGLGQVLLDYDDDVKRDADLHTLEDIVYDRQTPRESLHHALGSLLPLDKIDWLEPTSILAGVAA